MNLFSWLFPATVDSILSTFKHTVARLEAHASLKALERDANQLRAEVHDAIAEAAHAEMERAKAVAANIRKLFESHT